MKNLFNIYSSLLNFFNKNNKQQKRIYGFVKSPNILLCKKDLIHIDNQYYLFNYNERNKKRLHANNLSFCSIDEVMNDLSYFTYLGKVSDYENHAVVNLSYSQLSKNLISANRLFITDDISDSQRKYIVKSTELIEPFIDCKFFALTENKNAKIGDSNFTLIKDSVVDVSWELPLFPVNILSKENNRMAWIDIDFFIENKLKTISLKNVI